MAGNEAMGAGGSAVPTGATVQYPYPESNKIEDIVERVRDILMKHKDVQAIHILSGDSISVELSSEIDPQGPEDSPILLADIVMKIPLTPVNNKWDTPAAYLQNVMQRISGEGGHASFVVVGHRQRFCQWLTGQDDMREIFGMTIHDSNGQLPEDVAVVCVCDTKLATPIDVRRGYVLRMDPTTRKVTQI